MPPPSLSLRPSHTLPTIVFLLVYSVPTHRQTERPPTGEAGPLERLRCTSDRSLTGVESSPNWDKARVISLTDRKTTLRYRVRHRLALIQMLFTCKP